MFLGEEEKKALQYQEYIESLTPKKKLWQQMGKAFITGGIICVIGQLLMDFYGYLQLSQEEAGTWTSVSLIFMSVLLTGFQIYPKIVMFGGAGALVPITGFANGVAASAIEYRAQGQVYGIGAKIFTIAGPVILYGVLTATILGTVLWIFGMA